MRRRRGCVLHHKEDEDDSGSEPSPEDAIAIQTYGMVWEGARGVVQSRVEIYGKVPVIEWQNDE